MVLPVDRLELVLGGLEAILGKRHPLLLGEIAVDEILGRYVDLADTIVGELGLVVVTAEDPERGNEETHARYARQQQALTAADRIIAAKVSGDRGDPFFGAPVERAALAVQDVGKSHILTFP